MMSGLRGALQLAGLFLMLTNLEVAAADAGMKRFDDEVGALLERMTLEEKIAQMVYDAPAIERLDIPAYNWWNECLHGVARAGKAGVFPALRQRRSMTGGCGSSGPCWRCRGTT